MQQERAAVIFGPVAGLRHQDKIRLQADDRFQRSKSAKGDAEFAGRCFRVASPWDIVPHLQAGGAIAIIDACQSDAVAGTLHRCVSPESVAAAGTITSSHGGSLREALELGRSLGYDLSGVMIYGIEAEATDPGTSLSPAVRRAAETLANDICDAWRAPGA